MWNEIKRKLFHLTGMIYIVGLIFIPRSTYLLILAGMLAAEFAVELLRIKNAAVRAWYLATFGHLLREREHSRLSGIFWMLAGVFTTVLLTDNVPIATTALLYLLLGDGVASLVGMRFGGPHWPGSAKRLSGSLACFVVCLFVGAVMLRAEYGWAVGILGATAATFIERGVVPVDDNYAIPVGSTVVLLIGARLLTSTSL